MTTEMIWHNDGHVIHLRVDRSEVKIVSTDCPNKEDSACRLPSGDCAVQYFVNLYGFDCNAGACDAAESIQICWTIGGNIYDLDACQLWFMPIDDTTFQAWVSTMTSEGTSS